MATEQESVSFTHMDLLLVNVSAEVVAIPIESVREVIEFSKLTKVPMCPPVISGVINVRGSVVPVVDAACRLGLDMPQDYDKYSCIILHETVNPKTLQTMIVGLVVSRVLAIQSVEEEHFYQKPAFGSHIPNEFIWQMVQLDTATVPVLVMSAMMDGVSINDQMLTFQSGVLAKWES
ncbi:chemotaxis protein CheW [Vibrio sonorensis]|uniref:chemotaxis protein CheW n=1 Tax=Vibrio sonorensis TaxID=1004316 RepID=UPI0008D8D8A9|nr:chemotaxis protein CheW [Vibrio sonorensis]